MGLRRNLWVDTDELKRGGRQGRTRSIRARKFYRYRPPQACVAVLAFEMEQNCFFLVVITTFPLTFGRFVFGVRLSLSKGGGTDAEVVLVGKCSELLS